jgi:hypothetical protein
MHITQIFTFTPEITWHAKHTKLYIHTWDHVTCTSHKSLHSHLRSHDMHITHNFSFSPEITWHAQHTKLYIHTRDHVTCTAHKTLHSHLRSRDMHSTHNFSLTLKITWHAQHTKFLIYTWDHVTCTAHKTLHSHLRSRDMHSTQNFTLTPEITWHAQVWCALCNAWFHRAPFMSPTRVCAVQLRKVCTFVVTFFLPKQQNHAHSRRCSQLTSVWSPLGKYVESMWKVRRVHQNHTVYIRTYGIVSREFTKYVVIYGAYER